MHLPPTRTSPLPLPYDNNDDNEEDNDNDVEDEDDRRHHIDDSKSTYQSLSLMTKAMMMMIYIL